MRWRKGRRNKTQTRKNSEEGKNITTHMSRCVFPRRWLISRREKKLVILCEVCSEGSYFSYYTKRTRRESKKRFCYWYLNMIWLLMLCWIVMKEYWQPFLTTHGWHFCCRNSKNISWVDSLCLFRTVVQLYWIGWEMYILLRWQKKCH